MCDLEPRRHIMEDLNNEKFSLHLIQCRVCPYGLLCFSAIRDANLIIYTTVAVAPIPPAVVNTSGENEPCSILYNSSYRHQEIFLHCIHWFKKWLS